MTIGGRSNVATPARRRRLPAAPPAAIDAVSSPNLVLWLDADHPASIHGTGSSLDQWDDRSTYAQNMAATSTARPSTGTRTLNGVNVIDFDATNDKMGSTWIADPGASGIVTVWLVAVIDTNAANHVLFMNEASGGNEAFIQARTGAVIRLGAGGSNFDSAGGKFTTGVPFIMKAMWKQVSGALIRTTGTAATTGAAGSWGNTNPGHRLWLAANSGTGTSDPIDAGVGELIVYNDDVGTTFGDGVDSYLEAKWGLLS